MTPLTEEDLSELERLVSEATPEPWERVQTGVYADDVQVAYAVFAGGETGKIANAALIAASRQALPRLTADLRKERAEVERLRGALEQIVAGQFNCATHQYFMAAQGVARQALEPSNV